MTALSDSWSNLLWPIMYLVSKTSMVHRKPKSIRVYIHDTVHENFSHFIKTGYTYTKQSRYLLLLLLILPNTQLQFENSFTLLHSISRIRSVYMYNTMEALIASQWSDLFELFQQYWQHFWFSFKVKEKQSITTRKTWRQMTKVFNISNRAISKHYWQKKCLMRDQEMKIILTAVMQKLKEKL